MSSMVPSGGGNSASVSGAPGGLAGPSEAASNLADVLERVLDKGIVIVGDIRVNLLDIELLTIKLRLVVAGVDTARRMGIDWWERDPWLSGGDEDERRALEDRVGRLERQLGSGAVGDEDAPSLESENRELREEVQRLQRQLTRGSSRSETDDG